MKKKVIALYPGTFDPVTYGHIDIIERASLFFEKLIVTVAINPNKIPLFSEEERKNMVIRAVKKFSNVDVDVFKGLVVDYAKLKKASVIIRGLRAVSDFEYEFQMSLTNRKLAPGISTIFMMPNEKYTYLNSSLVRELISYSANVSDFVPPYVIRLYKKKIEKKK
ncbi:MAG: pantetheine-phosphate adenylyltransferase [Ignavibacteria bacterium]|nr:pantetheine-phosphate adenylyltransferase [Ignavibacteria bacterium]